jgi:hypothetical protein
MPNIPKAESCYQKVGECLYRYESSGTYYAVVRHQGKLIRRSLRTQDRALAKRLLADFRRDLAKVNLKGNRCALRELADRYLDTVKFQSAKTYEAKQLVVRRIQSDWPGGCDVQIKDVRSSGVKSWLASQMERMGKSSFNGYIQPKSGS